MNKRTFLRKTAVFGLGSMAATAGIAAARGIAPSTGTGTAIAGNSTGSGRSAGGSFTLPELPYSYDALEPHIDAMTMEIHHSRHHAGYTSKLNAAMEGTEYAGTGLKDLFAKASRLPVAIRNNGGGYWNHNLFWKVMSPAGGGKPSGDLADAINSSFGSFDKFRELFSNAAATRFGSGWAWLVRSGRQLKVTSTPNQDNPLMDVAEIKGTPVLGIDVWEHAYYLKYQNRRTDYIAAFWNVINWDFVAEKLMNAK